MPPPELATDAPVALLRQPIEVRLRIALGEELYLSIEHRLHCSTSKAWLAICCVAHLDEPLIRQIRLDGSLAAVGKGERDLAVFFAFEEAHFLHVFGHGLARLVAIHALI